MAQVPKQGQAITGRIEGKRLMNVGSGQVYEILDEKEQKRLDRFLVEIDEADMTANQMETRHIALDDSKLGQLRQNAVTVIGRNKACPCGSGKKFKHCHLRL